MGFLSIICCGCSSGGKRSNKSQKGGVKEQPKDNQQQQQHHNPDANSQTGQDVKGSPQDKEYNEATSENMHQIVEYNQNQADGIVQHPLEYTFSEENPNACVIM